MSDDTFDIKGLNNLVKALKQKPPIARVGILGDKNARKGNEPTNSSVGAAHEYGTSTLPQRSFLRVPITELLEKRMISAGALDEESLKLVVKQGSIVPWVSKIGALAVDIVLGAFDTGGYGKWKPSNMTHKEVKQTLVETEQLRNSIIYDVVK